MAAPVSSSSAIPLHQRPTIHVPGVQQPQDQTRSARITPNGTFTVSSSFQWQLPPPALLTNYTYDPLGRTITTANAVGTTTNTYSAWTQRQR